MTKVIDRIPADKMALYMAYKLSSAELAAEIGCHPVYLRRLIKRPKRPKPENKLPLIEARKKFRQSIAHLPTKDIQRLAHVSVTTAQRIKKQYATR